MEQKKHYSEMLSSSITDASCNYQRVNSRNIFSTIYLSEIINPFFRVSYGNLHDVKVFGPGLSYVKNIVGKQGASIEVKSLRNEGSLFTLTLPFK